MDIMHSSIDPAVMLIKMDKFGAGKYQYKRLTLDGSIFVSIFFWTSLRN